MLSYVLNFFEFFSDVFTWWLPLPLPLPLVEGQQKRTSVFLSDKVGNHHAKLSSQEGNHAKLLTKVVELEKAITILIF